MVAGIHFQKDVAFYQSGSSGGFFFHLNPISMEAHFCRSKKINKR